jgi:hypothetical protein
MKNTKAKIDRDSAQITADWKAGRITPDEAIDKLIAANCAWAQGFMSPMRVAQLELLLRTLADTDPTLLRLSGRSSK